CYFIDCNFRISLIIPSSCDRSFLRFTFDFFLRLDRERAGERPSAEMACKRSAEKVKAGTRTSSGVTVINTFGDVNPALLDLLYNKIGGQLANDVKNLEIRTGIRREQFVYAMMAFVAIYLVFGKEAGLLCNLIVFIYPAYATLQVTDSAAIDRAVPWLIYWTIFGAFSLIDFYAEKLRKAFPVYWLFKALFLSYLFLPQTGGTQKIYKNVIVSKAGKAETTINDSDNKKE
ncbi:Receptor expression-enhancing protein 5, partial [Toxocara canis]